MRECDYKKAVIEYFKNFKDKSYNKDKNYNKKKYKVFGKELFRIDVLVVADENEIIAVEVKSGKGDLRKGLGQAIDNCKYAHYSYLAVPTDLREKAIEIVAGTKIGLLDISPHAKRDKVLLIKKPEPNMPNSSSIQRILNCVTGQCWLCRRTLNIVPLDNPFAFTDSINIAPFYKSYNIPIALKSLDSNLGKGMQRALGIKIKSENLYIGICKICSRILQNSVLDIFALFLSRRRKYCNVFDESTLKYLSRYLDKFTLSNKKS